MISGNFLKNWSVRFIKTVLFEEGETALFAIVTVIQVHVKSPTVKHQYPPHSFTHFDGEYCSILRTDIWKRLKSTYCSLLVDFVFTILCLVSTFKQQHCLKASREQNPSTIL